MTIMSVLSFAGGIGLFLLGMRLMTDGLKLAAGNALRDILAHWTATPLRGIVAGVLITTAVQSSSAVIFATLGFVNAGLLTLNQAIGVILGSSLGSTSTSWLVALVGFKLELRLLALPAVALGTALRLSGGRRAAFGDALTGFGVFFIGIDVLKGSFDASSLKLPLEQFETADIAEVLLFTLIGIVLTALMQSSGASLALTLTAVAGGLIPVSLGAAVVIGANVGTTSTSIIAMIDATADARRAALGYVLFKLGLALVSLLALTPLLWVVEQIGGWLGLSDSPAVLLAIFHSLINLLGVISMRPLIEPLARFLQGRFRTQDEDESRPRHLDRNVADTPAMALDAIKLELARIDAIVQRAALGALSDAAEERERSIRDQQIVRTLLEAVNEFVMQLQRRELTEKIVHELPVVLAICRHYSGVIDNARLYRQLQPQLEPIADEPLRRQVREFREEARRLLSEPEVLARIEAGEAAQILEAWDDSYRACKAKLLRAGSVGRLTIPQMVARLDEATAIRRLVQQAIRAAAQAVLLDQAAADTTSKAAELVDLEADQDVAATS